MQCIDFSFRSSKWLAQHGLLKMSLATQDRAWHNPARLGSTGKTCKASP